MPGHAGHEVREDSGDLLVRQHVLEAWHAFAATTGRYDSRKGHGINDTPRDGRAQVRRHNSSNGVVAVAAGTVHHVLPPALVFDRAGWRAWGFLRRSGVGAAGGRHGAKQ